MSAKVDHCPHGVAWSTTPASRLSELRRISGHRCRPTKSPARSFPEMKSHTFCPPHFAAHLVHRFRFGPFWISCPESNSLSRRRVRNVGHSPSLQPFRFWRHPSGTHELDRRRNRQLSVSHNPWVCYSLVGVLVSCLGRDAADRAVRRAKNTSGVSSIDAGELMIRPDKGTTTAAAYCRRG